MSKLIKGLSMAVLAACIALAAVGCGGTKITPDSAELVEGFVYSAGDLQALNRVAVYEYGTDKDVVVRIKSANEIAKVDISGVTVSSDDYKYEHDKLVIENEFFKSFKKRSEKVLNITDSESNKISMSLIVADKIITTAQEFMAINDTDDAREGFYVLGNDIDLGGTDFVMIGNGDDSDPAYVESTYSFNGIFEGAGHTIKNVTITRKLDNAAQNYTLGLFRCIGGTGVVRNLAVTNADLSAGQSMEIGGGIAGIITGMNHGTIENCFVEGRINIAGDRNEPSGGVAGFSDGKISNCVSVVNITGFTICGGNFNVVENCVGFAQQGSQLDAPGIFRHADSTRLNDNPQGFQVKNQYVFNMYNGADVNVQNVASFEDLASAEVFAEFDPFYWNIQEGQTISLYKMYLPNIN